MRTKILGLIALIAVLTLVPTSAAQAAWPHERDGVLLGFGLGAGTAGVNILDIDSDRESGLGGSFRLGYAFTPQVAAGLEGTFWTKEADTRRRAAIERAHAALERAASDGRRDAGMADRLDHLLREFVRRLGCDVLRFREIVPKGIRLVAHRLLKAETRRSPHRRVKAA